MSARPLRRARHGVSRDRWLLSVRPLHHAAVRLLHHDVRDSTVDQGKLSKVAVGLQEALDSTNATAGGPGRIPASQGAVLSQEQLDARAILERDMAEDLRSGRMELLEDGRGLVLSIPEASAFATGSADSSTTAQQAIDRLADSLGKMSNGVLIEGHTDDVPIHTARFASNWDLSTARATAVVRWLIEQGTDRTEPTLGGRLRRIPPARAERVGAGAGAQPPGRRRDSERTAVVTRFTSHELEQLLDWPVRTGALDRRSAGACRAPRDDHRRRRLDWIWSSRARWLPANRSGSHSSITPSTHSSRSNVS
ncbi:MAG: OmpA family protein [Vicinamibacterales bacterium]